MEKMKDTIYRQDAIDVFVKWFFDVFGIGRSDRMTTLLERLKEIPSVQPKLARINDCNGCKFIGCYDTDFPCANCVRKDKDYYEPEG